MMPIKRLFDYLTKHTKATPEANFLSSKITIGDNKKQWKHYSFKETECLCNKVSTLLLQAGLQKDDTIAIISNNRPEWNFVDVGSQQIGVVNVPMYPTISEEDYAYIFKEAEIKYAFVGDEIIYKKVFPLLQKIPSLKKIISFEKIEGVSYFEDELNSIKEIDDAALNAIKDTVDENDTATIIYTSGTTGNPKGVMLTHLNIVSDLTGVAQVLPFIEGEKALSFLPLCHSFERTVFYAYLMFGIHIYYAENLDTIGENLKEVQPYCFTTVPRLLEKVYEKIVAKGNELTGLKRKLFFWSLKLGEAYELGKSKSFLYTLQLFIARKLIFSKWKEALGNRIEFIVTGAAAMQPRLIKIFTAAGIQVIEGYGLTETSPVLSVNRIPEKERCAGTIGLPIPGVEIRLADDGEIMARGKNIMKGYFKQPTLTDEVIDKNGWFYTGDIGTWIEHNGNNFLKITDRKKELFKTAGGKYIAPQAIENKMKESRFIEQIMVVGGDDKKYIAALIVPSFLQLESWAKAKNILYKSISDLINNAAVIELFNNEINKRNIAFGKWEQIKKFKLLSEEWTIQNGQLTPTLKLKRKAITQQYKSEIESLFID